MTLPMPPAHSDQRRQLGCVFDPSFQRICSCLPKNQGKACAHSFCMSFASRGRQAILPLTLGFMTSARIASPCFTRPSSRAPQVSAKRVRLSCSLKERVFSFMHHDVLHVGLSTPPMSSSPFAPVAFVLEVFDDSVVHGLLSCRLAPACELS